MLSTFTLDCHEFRFSIVIITDKVTYYTKYWPTKLESFGDEALDMLWDKTFNLSFSFLKCLWVLVRYVVIGWQSPAIRGIDGKKLKMKLSLREKTENKTFEEKPKMKLSLRETFPCGQKLVMTQRQRVQRDEKDTPFFRTMRHSLISRLIFSSSFTVYASWKKKHFWEHKFVSQTFM